MTSAPELDEAVSAHDLIISLIPYTFHVAVIKSAIKFKRNVVTTSYVSDAIKALEPEYSLLEVLQLTIRVKEAGIVVMNEIGLDPGIDHCSAISLIRNLVKFRQG